MPSALRYIFLAVWFDKGIQYPCTFFLPNILAFSFLVIEHKDYKDKRTEYIWENFAGISIKIANFYYFFNV